MVPVHSTAHIHSLYHRDEILLPILISLIPLLSGPIGGSRASPAPGVAGVGCGQTCTFIYKTASALEGSIMRQGPTSRGSCLVSTSLKPLPLLQPVWS